MMREDIRIGDTLWSWNTTRQGVVTLINDAGMVILRDIVTSEYFVEPHYALMPPPASRAAPVTALSPEPDTVQHISSRAWYRFPSRVYGTASRAERMARDPRENPNAWDTERYKK